MQLELLKVDDDMRKNFAKAALGNKYGAVATDSFRNMPARMGAGTPSLAEGTEYILERWSNNYFLMITLFRNHWLARRIVEKPAQDMCKHWCKLECELKPDLIADFDRAIRRTYTPNKIEQALVWANLYGGSGALMVIDGHEDILDEPLDLDDIAPNTYKGVIPFDRWSGISPKGSISSDITNPSQFGLPEMYTVNDPNGGEIFEIHSSRILRFTGPNLPNPEYQAQNYWGISKLEVVYEELRKRDNMSWSILQLLFRAQILTQVNPELASMLSGAGGSADAQQLFWQTYQTQNELLSNQSMLILGKDGKLESHAYSFGGVAEIYSQFQMDTSGAADMPVSLLFGRTVSGIGQTNDSDVRNYEQSTGQKQNTEVRPQLDRLYPVICMSEFGEVPDDLDFKFPSVRVLTEEEKSEIADKGGKLIIDLFTAGIISQKTALLEIKTMSETTGIGTNITDEDIAKADAEVEVPLEIEANEAKAGTAEFEE